MILVREWDSTAFHLRVLQLESRGYTAQLKTYKVIPETNPESGEVTLLHMIEMVRIDTGPRT